MSPVEFLVEFKLEVPAGTPQSEVRDREQAEAAAAAKRGHRRIVALTGGTFAGPELNGKLLPGASADWQIVLADGTALGDIRYTLQTDAGALIYVQSRSLRHGSAEVLARLGRGEDVDAGNTRSAPQRGSRLPPPSSTG